jgi:hypothetical protein
MNGSTEVARRNYVVPDAEYYSFELQPKHFCLNGAAAEWKIEPDVIGNQRGGYDLYAHNPFVAWDAFFNMRDEDIRSGRWDAHNDFTYPLRDVAVLGFPLTADSSSPAQTATAPLGDWLVDMSPQQPITESCQSVQSEAQPTTDPLIGIVAYRSGLCSKRVPYRTGDPSAPGLLEQVATGFWTQFETSDSISDVSQQYTKIVSAVTQPLPNIQWQHTDAAVDVIGAFILAFHYSASIIGVNRDIWGSYEYEFTLDDGALALVPIEDRLDSDWQDICPLCLYDGVQDGLQNKIPNQFHVSALASQSFPFPGSTCNAASDCDGPARFVAANLTSQALSSAGFESSDSQVNAAKCSLGDNAACDAIGRPRSLEYAWQCMSIPSQGPQNTCSLRLRASRLIPHEDEIELVWFDKPDWYSAAFALSVAAGPERRGDLCDPAIPTFPTSLGRRRTAFISLP